MPKGWRFWEWESCPYCGNCAEVYTDAGPGKAYDGDEVRCCECDLPGWMSVDEDGEATVSWHDEPDCSCVWCLDHPEE